MVPTIGIEPMSLPYQDSANPLSYAGIILAESRGVEPHPLLQQNPVFKAGRGTNSPALLSINLAPHDGIEPPPSRS